LHVPVYSGVSEVQYSEHEHRVVLEERAIEVGRVVSIVSLVVIDSTESLVSGDDVSRGIHVVQRDKPVELTINGFKVHKDWLRIAETHHRDGAAVG